MALVLAGAGWLVYAHVASDLKGSLDQQLRSRAQDVSALVRRDGSLQSTGGGLVERGESFAELLTANGTVVDATDPIGHVSLLARANAMDLPPVLRQRVKTQNPSNGELSHGIVS